MPRLSRSSVEVALPASLKAWSVVWRWVGLFGAFKLSRGSWGGASAINRVVILSVSICLLGMVWFFC